MAGAGKSTEAYSTQVAFLTDKINGYKATIAQATATLDTHTGSVQKSAAAHEKAAATIATAKVNLNKYQEQLDLLTNSQTLNGESVDDITAKLEAQASANVSLGFSISDNTLSLTQSFTATKNLSEALQVNQAAMDLARAKHIDLATATNQVILAMNGQGRALAAYGIQIKDGLSGMQALQAVQGAVNGQSQAYAETLSGQLSVAMASFNKLLADMGSTQLPILTTLLQQFVKIIDAVDSFAQKHKTLTEVILIAVGVLGAFITVLGTLLIIFGTIGLAVSLLGGFFIGLITIVVALTTAIIMNWGTISAKTQELCNALMTFFKAFWEGLKVTTNTAINAIATIIESGITGIQIVWNAIWGGVNSFFVGIWDGMKTAVTSAISFIQDQLTHFVSWASGVLGPILGAINAVGSAASVFGKGVAGVVSSAASVLNIHDAIITPGGQVIQSDPADFLIATKTPGSLVGAGGGGPSITVNILGGYYLDSNAATQIGNELAKKIVQQIKVRNYKP